MVEGATLGSSAVVSVAGLLEEEEEAPAGSD